MGRYIAKSDLDSAFGADSISQWSQIDSSIAAADTARIDTAIAYAEDLVDERFRGSPYVVPLRASGAALPRTLIDWCTKIAACWLYEHRGRRDGQGDEPTNRYDSLRAAALGEIDNALAGQRQLALARGASTSTVPRVITG